MALKNDPTLNSMKSHLNFYKTVTLLLENLTPCGISCRDSRVKGVRSKILKSSFQDIDDISLLISEIEMDGKNVPILLRHYLKLNGSLISFRADEAFSSVVDGLLLVDLTGLLPCKPRLLRRG